MMTTFLHNWEHADSHEEGHILKTLLKQLSEYKFNLCSPFLQHMRAITSRLYTFFIFNSSKTIWTMMTETEDRHYLVDHCLPGRFQEAGTILCTIRRRHFFFLKILSLPLRAKERMSDRSYGSLLNTRSQSPARLGNKHLTTLLFQATVFYRTENRFQFL